MSSYHLQTVHTWGSIRQGSSLDWSVQPEVFKQYPHEFPLITIDHLPELKEFLYLCAGLTARKIYPGGDCFLRVNPSAGALYPCEMYVQARNVAGLKDGVYHFEPQTVALRRLHCLNADEGIESCFRDRQRITGLVLLFSAIYYRSSWKYGTRALRYCLLDTGHVLGAVEAAASCMEYPFFVHYQLDHVGIGNCFGFQEQELVMAAVVCGREESQTITALSMKLPFVSGGGQQTTDEQIEYHYTAACKTVSSCMDRKSEKPWLVGKNDLKESIIKRRSIRSFAPTTLLTLHEYETICLAAMEPVNSDCDQQLQIWSLVHRVDGLQPGIYRASSCLRQGDFAETCGYLCLEQQLGADSGVTIFLTATSGQSYLPLMQKAGLIGQRIYLTATLLNIGCSGIGAFYDQEIADFLDTENLILYAVAVGR